MFSKPPVIIYYYIIYIYMENNIFLNSNFIFIILALFLLIIIQFIYKSLDNNNFCKNVKKQTHNNNTITDNINKDVEIKDLTFKSSYNTCCVGNYKFDYVDLCGIVNAYNNNACCLDFQIFSKRNNPVIACSTSLSTQYKETFNHIPFSEAMKKVNEVYMNESSGQNYPLFLNLRLYTSNIDTLNYLHEHITSIFGYENIYTTKNTFGDVTINDIIDKIILIVDIDSRISENLHENFDKSKLKEITTLTNSNNDYNNLYNSYRYDENIVNTNNVSNKDELSALYPPNTPTALNYDINIPRHFNFMFINFQTNDIYLQKYNNKFIDKIQVLDYNTNITTSTKPKVSYEQQSTSGASRDQADAEQSTRGAQGDRKGRADAEQSMWGGRGRRDGESGRRS